MKPKTEYVVDDIQIIFYSYADSEKYQKTIADFRSDIFSYDEHKEIVSHINLNWEEFGKRESLTYILNSYAEKNLELVTMETVEYNDGDKKCIRLVFKKVSE